MEILATDSDLVEATFRPNSGTQEVAIPPNSVSWQQSLKLAFRSNQALLAYLGLPAELKLESHGKTAAELDFPVLVPREYAARMIKGDPHDPLLAQVLAGKIELSEASCGMRDPVGDQQAELIPGLLQKYARRALLITSGACAVHCRYCFRRHYPYSSAPTGIQGWQPALDHIRQDRSIDEVILSGGDPLTVTDNVLRQLIDQLNQIDHIRRIRIHTRVPVVIPSRVCDSLLDWVSSSKVAIYFVLHFNHFREIDSSIEIALSRLRQAGATLLNQSVLLRGVNDSFEALRDLFLRLIDLHVLPYYLHQLDQVEGALHFQVSDARAMELIDCLRADLPGFAVPKLVREIAGESSKTPIVR